MKKFLSIALLAIAASVLTAISAGTPVNQSELPEAARSFLTKYFAGDNVKKAEKEQGRRGLEYEVDLTSGAEVDFTDKGEWKEVKAGKGKEVPAGIIPPAIAKYISANHAGLTVTEIARKRGGYELKLSNGTELRLTEEAKPLPAQRNGQRGQRPGRR